MLTQLNAVLPTCRLRMLLQRILKSSVFFVGEIGEGCMVFLLLTHWWAIGFFLVSFAV